jgi:hypothetical protein
MPPPMRWRPSASTWAWSSASTRPWPTSGPRPRPRSPPTPALASATPASGWSSRRSPATSPATTPAVPPSSAATGCPPATPRCSWTPTAPTTPHRSRSPSRASPGCCRSCWRPTAPAVASPTPPTGNRCGVASPRSTGRCSSTSWPAPGCPPCRRWTGGCGHTRRPACWTWAAASAPPRSRSAAPTRAPGSWGSTWTRHRSPRPARQRPRRAWPTASASWSATPPRSPRSPPRPVPARHPLRGAARHG